MDKRLTADEVTRMTFEGSYLAVVKAIAADLDLDTGAMYLISAAMHAAETNGMEKAMRRVLDLSGELQAEVMNRKHNRR